MVDTLAKVTSHAAIQKLVGNQSKPANGAAPESLEDLEEWPELIPLDTPQLPRLDLNHIPGWAGKFTKALSTATETPEELATGLVLATLAAAAARRLRVRVKAGYIEPCNLWTVAVLPSGNRKSAVQKAATLPLLDWERDQAGDIAQDAKRVASENKTMEARAKEIRTQAAKEKNNAMAEELARQAAELEAELPDIPKAPQLWTSDATPERLGDLLADNGECMAWCSTEGGIFDLLQGRYSNGIPNLDLVLKAHSGDPERVDRGSRTAVYLRNPRLSVGLSPQPEVLRGLAAKPGFRGRGLLARFQYLLPTSPLGYRTGDVDPMPDQIREAYDAGVKAMLNWEIATDDRGNECPHLLDLSDEAFAEWRAFFLGIEAKMRPGGDMEHFTDWAGKAPGAAARIAGILHGIKHAHDTPWDKPISKDTMNSALELMGVITTHSVAALATMGADPTIAAARVVWEWIERGRRHEELTVREIFNALRGTFPRVSNLRDALDALEERGYIEIVDQSNNGPGRPPSPKVRIRKEIRDKWQ